MTMLFFAFLEYADMPSPARQRLAASVRLALARGLSTTCGTVQRGIVSPAFSTRVWYAPEMAVTPRAPAEETTHCPPSKNAPRSPQPQATTLPSFLRARLWNLPAAIAVTPVAAAAGTVHCPSTMALATALYKPSLDRLGDPLGDRRHGQVRVRPRDVGDHRGVRDDEPFVAEDAAALVDDRTHRARAGGVEEAALGGAHIDLRAHVRSGPLLPGQVGPEWLAADELAHELHTFDQHGHVPVVAEEAVVDRERLLGVGRAQADAAARGRLHREDRGADRPSRVGRREEEQVAEVFGAGRGAPAHGHLTHPERVRCLEPSHLLAHLVGRLIGEAHADVVEQALADRKTFDAAPEQDSRRPVCACRDDHRRRAQLAPRRHGAHRARPFQEHAVYDRVAEDGQVLPPAGGVDVGERSVPAPGPDGVHRVEDRVGPAGLREEPVPGRELVEPEVAHSQLALRAAQVRLELLVAPAWGPAVVGRCALEQD